MSTVQRIGLTIRQLASEHGLPNSFTVGEIALESGIHQMTVGQQVAADLPAIASHAGLTLFREQREGYTYIDAQEAA